MPDPTWPSTLPAPLIEGYNEEEPDQVHVMQPDVGAPKTRPRVSAAYWPIDMQFIVDVSQLEEFRTFYRVTTKSGELPWMMEEPLEGGTMIRLIFNPEEPPGVEPVSGNLHRISFRAYNIDEVA